MKQIDIINVNYDKSWTTGGGFDPEYAEHIEEKLSMLADKLNEVIECLNELQKKEK